REIKFLAYSSYAPPMMDGAGRVSVHFLLDLKDLLDGTFLEYFSKKKVQTELSCYQATNVDLVLTCIQGLPVGESDEVWRMQLVA
ncbi:MAG: hypothetical protein EZS28_028782, partial [Streblomastix strix]